MKTTKYDQQDLVLPLVRRWLSFLVIFILGSILFHLPVGKAQASPNIDPDLVAIDGYIRSKMKETRLPGLAIGIVHKDEIIFLKGYGHTGTGQDVTPQTPFLIGSTGKSFTAMAIMQLVESGAVELDAPVQHYVPWFTLADPDASRRITIRQLLNHTSGIPTDAGLRNIEPDDRPNALAERVRTLNDVSPITPGGTEFHYSNANYEILGLVVEVVSGMVFEDYLGQHILQPLDMDHSYFMPREAEEDNASSGHRYLFGLPVRFDFPYNRGLIPPGVWWSSAEDMTHYLIANLKQGKYRGTAVLSADGIEMLHKPAIRTVGGPIASDEWYAMGWFIRDSNGLVTISHAGTLPNFHANLVLVPEGQWGIVILMNAENGLDPEPIGGIARHVTEMLVGSEPWETGTNDFYRTLFNYLLAGVAIQISGMTFSMVRLRRPKRQSGLRMRKNSAVVLPVVSSMVFNGLWAAVCLLGVPAISGGSTSNLYLFIPDFAFLLTMSGIVSILWAILHPILILRRRRRS